MVCEHGNEPSRTPVVARLEPDGDLRATWEMDGKQGELLGRGRVRDRAHAVRRQSEWR